MASAGLRDKLARAARSLLGARGMSTSTLDIRQAVAAKIPEEQERLKQIKAEYGQRSLGEVTVNMAVGGMRGIKGMLWETSLLDADEGIRFRGHSIPELQAVLPTAGGGHEPLPEGLLWLLLTGDIPSVAQVSELSAELQIKSALPPHVLKVLKSLPERTHPMTQFSIGVMAMQDQSVFARAYQAGMNKSKFWQPVLEDSIHFIAKLPTLAATIYRQTYYRGNLIDREPGSDWAGGLAQMMGFPAPEAKEMMRLYQTIHADHEGGNVSAHTAHVVASALSDPYLSFAAAINGLAGPLHGLANQEVLRWLKDLTRDLGENPSAEQLAKYCRDTLAAGHVVPGYGHAVLRKTDPRYTCQREFALKHLPDYPLFQIVSRLYEVVPNILLETGKVKNPWPNVDAHSGVLLQYYGIKEENFYTVLFGVSRALGVLSQGVWSRALGLPIERPKSLTMSSISQWFR